MYHYSLQAFTVTTIFNVLMFSLAILPFGIRAIAEARIALRRLRVYLLVSNYCNVGHESASIEGFYA